MTKARRSVRWLATFALASLVCSGGAAAHAPTSAIGRAVEAFGNVPVSYEPGAAVSVLEADRILSIVGSNPSVAFMSTSAADELSGGPNAIAEEIAREADLDGTLVVLVGAEIEAWSNEIDEERLSELVGDAKVLEAPPAVRVESLVRSIQADRRATCRGAGLARRHSSSGSAPWPPSTVWSGERRERSVRQAEPESAQEEIWARDPDGHVVVLDEP